MLFLITHIISLFRLKLGGALPQLMLSQKPIRIISRLFISCFMSTLKQLSEGAVSQATSVHTHGDLQRCLIWKSVCKFTIKPKVKKVRHQNSCGL